MARLLVGPVLRFVDRTSATVWVEVDEACRVEILGVTERTFEVAGHHYALVIVEGLQPGASTPYEVTLDGEQVWPPADSRRPASVVRTLGDPATTRLVFGSCRYGRAAATAKDRHFDPDALVALAREVAGQDAAARPDAILMLGDQVYADETSEATQRRIRARRDITRGARDQVADFEEYTWLYLESWTDPDVRWLLSTVPSAMIFDDHDVRDDWNTSHAWRLDLQSTDWWQERIVGGLASYWVYQHLGNLSPAELRANELFTAVRAADGDVIELLRDFAAHADAEVDGAKGTRWSFRRDFGRVRLVVIDSRCGRILADGARSMVSEDEFTWIEDQLPGDYDHLLVGTSLPWLLARALHDLEAWDEVLCDGRHGRLRARFGEWLRRAADLEHWASFGRSFDRLGDLLAQVGSRTDAPASICVLSGDVHHGYIARAAFVGPGDAERAVRSPVYQLTCSPLHNYVPWFMHLGFRIFWSRLAERTLRVVLALVARVPTPPVRWRRVAGPFFGNELAEFVARGREARTSFRRTVADGDDVGLDPLASVTISS